jgi:hypothetical protein
VQDWQKGPRSCLAAVRVQRVGRTECTTTVRLKSLPRVFAVHSTEHYLTNLCGTYPMRTALTSPASPIDILCSYIPQPGHCTPQE